MSGNLLPLVLGVLVAAPAAFAQKGQGEQGPIRGAAEARPDAVEVVKEAAAKADGDKPKLKAPRVRVARPPAAKSEKPVRKVYPLKHVPAQDLAAVIYGVLRGESQGGDGPAGKAQAVAIVPDPVTNTLVISSAPRIFEEIAQLIKALDRRPATVQVRALIAEISTDDADDDSLLDDLSASAANHSIDELASTIQKLPRLRMLTRPQVTVLDNQPGFLQLGQRVPRITGTQISPAGRTNQMVLENVGLILAVTARTNAEGLVTMEIDLEKSHLGPEEEGTTVAVPSQGDPIRTPQIETLTLQTTVSAASGQTVVLGGLRGKSEARQSELIVLISPRIVQP